MYNDEKTQIVGIDNIEIITNGTLDDMIKVTNPNQIGQIIYIKTNEVKS